MFFAIIIHFNSFCQTDTAVSYKYWLYVCESNKKEKYYIRSQYENKSNYVIKIWVKSVMPLVTIKNKKYKNAFKLDLYLIDCKNQKSKGVQGIMYSSDGEVLAENNEEEDSFNSIIPETVMEQLFKYACERFN